MKIGNLEFLPLAENIELAAESVMKALSKDKLTKVLAAKIDPKLADTESFCRHYNIGLDISANCVVVRAKRADRIWYAALMILATARADINKTVKKHLNARKLSFAHMDEAINLTKMEFGGITPIGLPKDWQLLVDNQVKNEKYLIVGSGIRGSKLLVSGEFIAGSPNAEVLDMAI